jgi:ABC-type methionine transport system ATPase subunit
MTVPKVLKLDSSGHNRPTLARIRVKIPKKYHHEPVIANLAAEHHLKVNILSAILTKDPSEDGWFDLEVIGNSQEIDAALIYLSELDIQVWHEAASEIDGW